MLITSLQNPKIKQALKLWKRGERDQTRCFLIEGYRELSRAVGASASIHTLFICPELFLGTNEQHLINALKGKGTDIYTCSETVFRKLSYRDRPDGLIGIARHLQLSLDKFSAKQHPLYVVAEKIEKPGNLGTILRSADASHVDGVIVCDRCTDVHNPNVVRASVGTLFTVPVAEAESNTALQWLKERGIAIVAATPSAKIEYTEVNLSGPIAIAVGAEQYGLSQTWLKEADLCVKIPMLGVADSLNVAMAATLLLYEAVRQRKAHESLVSR